MILKETSSCEILEDRDQLFSYVYANILLQMMTI